MSIISKSCGVSRMGPLHKKNNLENQDSFYISCNKDYTLALVSDGLGSKKYSAVGSKMAGPAVNNSIKKILQERNSLEEEKFGAALISNLATEWTALISPKSPEDCSATCLFTIITKNFIYCFRLGDGMIFLKAAAVPDPAALADDILLQDDKGTDFSNSTVSLSNPNMMLSWETKKLNKKDYSNIVLTTDGISSDLQPGSEKAFVTGLLENLKNKPYFIRKIILRRMIKNWPVPKHTDDKTIVVVDL